MAFKMNPDGSMVPIDKEDGPKHNVLEESLSPNSGSAQSQVNANSVTSMSDGGTNDLIKESSTANFMLDVIEASMQVPVIVDFWAPWCGPCKQLGPALEKAVKQAGGLVRMVKVNVDENQELASQLRVQSIPAVFAFKEGRPVDGFSGALPDSQIKTFIERLLGDARPPLEQALIAAKEMLDAGSGEEALAIYRQVQTEVPDNETAIAGVIRSFLALGDQQSITELLQSLPAEMKSRSEIAAAISAVELDQAAKSAGDTEPLRNKVAADPKNPEARFDLAMALFAASQHEAAIDEFLEIIRLNRNWNEEAGRVQLLKVFDTLGPTHELTVSGRKRLSAILFS